MTFEGKIEERNTEKSTKEVCPEFLKLRYWWNKEVFPLLPGGRYVGLKEGEGSPGVRAVSDVSMDRVFEGRVAAKAKEHPL